MDRTIEVTKPTVHMNGTSGEELLAQVRKPFELVQPLIDALIQMRPNARDYYVSKDPDAFTKALDEHQRRIDSLLKTRKELEALYEYLYDTVEERKARRAGK